MLKNSGTPRTGVARGMMNPFSPMQIRMFQCCVVETEEILHKLISHSAEFHDLILSQGIKVYYFALHVFNPWLNSRAKSFPEHQHFAFCSKVYHKEPASKIPRKGEVA